MITETKKVELIQWINLLTDVEILKKIEKLKKNDYYRNTDKRKFGCGRGLISYIANDFDEPLDEFKEYQL